MSRTIDPILYATLTDKNVDLFYAVELFFDQGTMRLWTGIGDKTINGNVFTGTGSLLSISAVEETDGLSASGVNISLSGIDLDVVSVALQEPYQNRLCKVHVGSVINSLEAFSGFMDTMTIDDSGDTCTINLTVESRLILLDRKVSLRYTQETQESRYPDDTFFSYVESLADKQIVWGRATETK